jgi:hypothetical protein
MDPDVKAQRAWPQIIGAVKTPLGFLVLAELIYSPVLGWLLVKASTSETLIVSTLLAMSAIVAVVIFLAVYQPEALKGERPLQKEHAEQFANDIFDTLEGYVSNLTVKDEKEAWLTTVDVIASRGEDSSNSEFKDWCRDFSAHLKRKANTKAVLRKRVRAS